MPKRYTSKEIVKVLLINSFIFISQKGSHAKYRKTDVRGTKTVIVPISSKPIPIGTFSSILRQSGLSHEDFT